MVSPDPTVFAKWGGFSTGDRWRSRAHRQQTDWEAGLRLYNHNL